MGNKATRPNKLQSKISECVDAKGTVDYKKLQELKEKWELTECDIAIVGSSGCGKSTLINNLLGIRRKTEAEENKIKEEISKCEHKDRQCKHHYAPTSSEECTSEPVPYSFEKDTRVYLWDLPGYGAEFYPTIRAYWKKLEIDKYDAFLVVSRDNRVTQQDKEIVQYLVDHGKLDRLLWVRTHFDDAMKGRLPEEEQIARERISEVYLKKMGISAIEAIKLFCVGDIPKQLPSNNTDHMDEEAISYYVYDINKLKAAITKTVPEEMQMQLAAKFQGYSADLIAVKFVTLQKWSVLTVLSSTGVAAASSFVPIAGSLVSAAVDFTIINAFHNKVVEVYGFSSTDELVARLALDNRMQKVLQVQVGVQTSKILADVMARVTAGIVASTLAEAAASFVPFVGAAVSGVLSGSVMTWACHHINTTFHDVALYVIKLIDEQNTRTNK